MLKNLKFRKTNLQWTKKLYANENVSFMAKMKIQGGPSYSIFSINHISHYDGPACIIK
jgi:hypothetical protein